MTDIRSVEAGRIDTGNDFTALDPWFCRLGSALHSKDIDGKKDLLRDMIALKYEVDPTHPDNSDGAQVWFIHIAFDRMANYTKAIITADTISWNALF